MAEMKTLRTTDDTCPVFISLKVGFHYQSSRPEFTGRVDGPRTRVNFLTPVNSGRQLVTGRPCTRPVLMLIYVLINNDLYGGNENTKNNRRYLPCVY